MPIVVKSLERQTDACPTQWFGWAIDGRAIYARYRMGALTVAVGASSPNVPDYVAEGETFVWLHPTEAWAGTMQTVELIEHTRGFLDFDAANVSDTCAARSAELLALVKRLPEADGHTLIREGLSFLVPVQSIESGPSVFLTNDRKALLG